MNNDAINLMKLNVLEAHDRLQYIKKTQSIGLSQGCEDCLKKNELSLALQSRSPYIYIYSHPRTTDDGCNKKMLWQPRLTRPKPETNSYLFRATSFTDIIEICWMIPPREQWEQYKKGNIAENEIVQWSVDKFINKRNELAANHPDDLPDEKSKNIYLEVLRALKKTKQYSLVVS